jgi:hypothetical protein
MFNMGGPIKEGVMHGIREPYKGGQLVRPGPGRPGYAGEAEINWWKKLSNQMPKGTGTAVTAGTTGAIAANAAKKANMFKRAGSFFTKGIKGPAFSEAGIMQMAKNLAGWRPGGIPFQKQIQALGTRFPKTGPILPLYGAFKAGEAINKYTKPANQALSLQLQEAGALDPTSPNFAGQHLNTGAATKLAGMEQERLDELNKKIDPSTVVKETWTPGGTDTAPILTKSMRDKVAQTAKDRRVNKLLEMMGHKQSKKDAVYDALIDASQIVGAAPGGKGLDISKDIIRPIIGATSKRFDKPKEIEEAVRLMMVKGEIEKDIASGKGGPLKQNAKDLVAAGVFKNETEAMKHLASKKTMGNVVAEVSKQFGISGANADVLDTSLRIKEDVIPEGKWKGDSKAYKKFKNENKDKADIELEFVKDIDDRKAGDYYIVDKRIVLVDENLNPDYYY